VPLVHPARQRMVQPMEIHDWNERHRSPSGNVYPCVQFPTPSGNVRRTKFADIWRDSPQLKEVRSITLRDMPSCFQCTHGAPCTRCPGLAYLEENLLGPSYQDCEKSYARTGIPSENFKARNASQEPFNLNDPYEHWDVRQHLCLCAFGLGEHGLEMHTQRRLPIG
jgi:radical SAM protein with 4Fe4S-binding SPASM domain